MVEKEADDQTSKCHEQTDREVLFDEDAGLRIELAEPTVVTEHDLENLRKLEAVECEVVKEGERLVVKSCTVQVKHLAHIAADLDTVERRFGDRWKQTGWDAPLEL